jgi:antitoxin component YwqK of YwqJK toxin-antitoxin module
MDYTDGLLQGEVLQTFPNGSTRSVGSWKDGLRDGVWKFYHSDGSLDALTSGTYKENNRVADMEGNAVSTQSASPSSSGPAGAANAPGGGQ